MSQIVNQIKKKFYLDSVALMRMSAALSEVTGVSSASMMSATPANLKILTDAGLLDATGKSANPEDLVIAVQLDEHGDADSVLAAAEALLSNITKNATGDQITSAPTLAAACEIEKDANLALISVPGEFAVREAFQALDAGLDVMIFSDNINLEDELRLKQHAKEVGRLVMGPDCGTALIQGTPLAFANRVPVGDVGIIAASGTGLQEVSCLLAHAGRGTSHAIGTGGRDLSDDIGGLTTSAAIDLLANDPNTRELVLLSKPAGTRTRDRILEQLSLCGKPVTVCFIGETASQPYQNVHICRTLIETAKAVVGGGSEYFVEKNNLVDGVKDIRQDKVLRPEQTDIHGLFAGGTLCAEAQLVLMDAGLAVYSNVAISGANATSGIVSGHCLLDLGADEYTLGRPHPMIEPAIRTPILEQSMTSPNVAVVLIDVVLGTGSHLDPAGSVAKVAATHPDVAVVASVCGTDLDPQPRSQQIATLTGAGIIVTQSNADAARLAAAIVTPG